MLNVLNDHCASISLLLCKTHYPDCGSPTVHPSMSGLLLPLYTHQCSAQGYITVTLCWSSNL